jgi:DNA-binding response OmpR family regulator
VEDDEKVMHFLTENLKESGYEVSSAVNGTGALAKAETQRPDMIILDLILPKIDGYEVLKRLRSFSSVPVIILSARGDSDDIVKGLSLGADDYIHKPFDRKELLARIMAVRRRYKPAESGEYQEVIDLGKLIIHLTKQNIVFNGLEIELTRNQWLLLCELAHNIENIVPYKDLLERVWGPEFHDDFPLLRTEISRLRKKLLKCHDIDLIHAIPKRGYVLRKPS